MPTLAQLKAESWWGREIVTPELSWLGAELCRRTGRPADAFGSKGNAAHLSGGHRSQEWLKNSDYCENRSYTAQTGLTSDQLRHIAACDWTPGVWGTAANRALMVAQTRNLWDAAKAGRLAGLRQVFGTLDGKTAIGLNVLTGSITYPDDSHRDHWHLTFDRRYMHDAGLMARIADIALNGADDDMNADQDAKLNALYQVLIPDPPVRVQGSWTLTRPDGRTVPINPLYSAIDGVAEKVEKIARPASPPPAQVDIPALVAALRPELDAAAERAVRKVLGTLDNV